MSTGAPAATSKRVQASFFRLEADGIDFGTFTSVSGLSLEVEVVTHKAAVDGGGMFDAKMPSRTKVSEITLKRGLTTNRSLNDWVDEIVDAKETSYKNGSIVCVDREDVTMEIARFNFFDGYATKLSVSDLDASGAGEAMVEEVTIRHHRLEWA